mmetsp:Transcript_35667/g.78102  ORF Transcript_35667/g.78102 Transcript_35667/m.78102 type:complete len:343 (-) Transcript_35667:549-1577(-)
MQRMREIRGERDAAEGSLLDVVGMKDKELRRLGTAIQEDADHIAVVLSVASLRALLGDEERLPEELVGLGSPDFLAQVHHVHLQQLVHGTGRARGGEAVGVAVGPALLLVGHGGEVKVAVADLLSRPVAGAGLQGIAPEVTLGHLFEIHRAPHGDVGLGITEGELWRARHVDDHAAINVLEAIREVEGEVRVHLDDLRLGTVARHQDEHARLVLEELHAFADTLHSQEALEDLGEVEVHGPLAHNVVVLGHQEVVVEAESRGLCLNAAMYLEAPCLELPEGQLRALRPGLVLEAHHPACGWVVPRVRAEPVTSLKGALHGVLALGGEAERVQRRWLRALPEC